VHAKAEGLNEIERTSMFRSPPSINGCHSCAIRPQNRLLSHFLIMFNAIVKFSHCSMKLISLLAQGSPFLAVTRALSERNAWTGFVRLMIDPPGFRCLTRIGNREDRPIAGRQCRLCNWRSHVCLELSHHNLGLCEALVPSFYVLAEM
jgi:hypothetical protein